jgi:hypothetical protein
MFNAQEGRGDFAALTGFRSGNSLTVTHDSVPRPANGPGNGLADGEIHGTTVIAVKYKDGVINVGDRRATGGFAIMYDQAEKVLSLDDFTLMAISGSFSKAMEIVRYLRHAFRYYERSQLQKMSLDGKLSELSKVIAGNAMAAMQGMGVVIPVLSTFDPEKNEGRIFFTMAAALVSRPPTTEPPDRVRPRFAARSTISPRPKARSRRWTGIRH